MKKRLSYLSVLVLLMTIGIIFFSKESSRNDETRLQAEAPSPRELIQSKEEGGASEKTSSSIAFQKTSQLELLEKEASSLKLTREEQALQDSPSANEWEDKLKLAIVARNHSDTFKDGPLLGKLYVEEMKKNPREAMIAIESIVEKLSPEFFAIDRAALLQVSLLLEDQREAAHQLAVKELERVTIGKEEDPSKSRSEEELNRALSTNKISFIPLAAHLVFLKTSDSPETAYAGTFEAIQKNGHIGVRSTIAAQFARNFPELQSKLYRELKKAQIPLLDSGT